MTTACPEAGRKYMCVCEKQNKSKKRLRSGCANGCCRSHVSGGDDGDGDGDDDVELAPPRVRSSENS